MKTLPDYANYVNVIKALAGADLIQFDTSISDFG